MSAKLATALFFTVIVACLGACGQATPTDPAPAASATFEVAPPQVSDRRPTVLPARPTPVGGGSGLLAFSSQRDGFSQIYTIQVDGRGLTRLTDGDQRLRQPVWSPDGSRIAYVQIYPGGQNLDIMVMAADGSRPVAVTTNAHVDSDPAWSPDGTRIAFATNRDSPSLAYTGNPRHAPPSNFEIYVVDLADRTLARLTDDPGWDTAPSWSSDGTQIAFQSDRDGNSEIYVMNADGSGQMKLTQHPADDGDPAWSPSPPGGGTGGDWIAFHSDREAEGNFDIYVMAADGRSEPVRLTDYPGWDISPTWSPDGAYLAFYREHQRNFEVYVLAVPGAPGGIASDLIRLTDDQAFDGFASWQPVPASPAASGPVAPPRPTVEPAARYREPDSFFDEIDTGGQKRRFLVHIPPGYRPEVPAPLILSFHGGGETIALHQARSGLSDLADERGFVVVYPQGLLPGSTLPESIQWPSGEVVFVRELLSHLEARLSIDAGRIYASGFSAGGAFAHWLGCALSDKVAAVAPVAGAYYMYAAQACRPQRPVPVVAFHGTGDYSSRYAGSDQYGSVPRWAEGWAGRNGCDATPTVIHQEVNVQRETWGGCQAGASVTLYTIQDGPHAWPRRAIDATEVMADFFEAHPWAASEATVLEAGPTAVAGAIHDRPGVYFDRIVHRSYPRWFKVHVPPGYEPGVPMALVLSLHGLGADLEQQERLSDLSVKADEAGFIAVYPQAGASVWNIQAGEIGAIDVDFVRKLIAYLEERLRIDPARIYATGFSNGGGMAHRLACDLSDRIAAIAPVSGAYSQQEACRPSRPVPVLAFHSEADRSAPFVNEQLGIDIPRWAADWARRNGCETGPAVSPVAEGVTVRTWDRCREEATVALYVIDEMGHTWPGSPTGRQLGAYGRNLAANDLIWEFFLSHPKK